ncbi:hypothetical protein [Alcaligenes faecalis]|uniref:hypothetical protein n=1 Tax=Alcaligenes faecalis TaxID=511 RepID=UPI00118763DD|nr:hypothetical protein [Alcaligenes faecalis]
MFSDFPLVLFLSLLISVLFFSLILFPVAVAKIKEQFELLWGCFGRVFRSRYVTFFVTPGGKIRRDGKQKRPSCDGLGEDRQ